MNCTCHNREPCPIHKEHPLPIVDLATCNTYVIHVFELWPKGGEKSWFFTVTKDAIQIYKSEPVGTKKAITDRIGLVFAP
jgi:hypothetical protein